MIHPCPKPEKKGKKPRTRLKVRNKNPLPQKTIKEVFERDDNQCLECGSKTGLHPHHVVRRSQASKAWVHDPRNLWTLCFMCHGRTETDQSFYRAVREKAKQRFGWFAGEEI